MDKVNDLVNLNIDIGQGIEPDLKWSEIQNQVMSLIITARKKAIEALFSGGRGASSQVFDHSIKSKDYERVIIWPSIMLQLGQYHNQIADFSESWSIKINTLFLVWSYLTIIDQKSDGELCTDVEPARSFLNDTLTPAELKQLNSIENSYSEVTKFETFDDYMDYLSRRYSYFGRYVQNILHDGGVENMSDQFSSYLRGILVTQQILDDIADWKADLQNNQQSWVVQKLSVISDQNRIDGVFLLQVLPEIVVDIQKYIMKIKNLEVGNDKIQLFLKDILSRSENINQNLYERLVS